MAYSEISDKTKPMLKQLCSSNNIDAKVGSCGETQFSAQGVNDAPLHPPSAGHPILSLGYD